MSKLKEVRRIESADGIKCGTYKGIWCGFVVTFETPFGEFEGKTDTGVKGQAFCLVTVSVDGKTVAVCTESEWNNHRV